MERQEAEVGTTYDVLMMPYWVEKMTYRGDGIFKIVEGDCKGIELELSRWKLEEEGKIRNFGGFGRVK